MTVKAIYENGVFRPKEPVDLAEHTEVEVVLPPADSSKATARTAWDSIEEIIGIVKNAPKDMAENHNFYLYGYDLSASEP